VRFTNLAYNAMMSMQLLEANPHAFAVLGLTVLALLLFTRQSIPLETSSLFILCLLVLGFELFPYTGPEGEFKSTDLYAGFAHPALIAVSALMVLGHGLVRTGALEVVGTFLSVAWRKNAKWSFLLTMLVAAFLSSFVNNTPIIILLLPIMVSVCIKNNISTSSVLLPVNFATLLGGMGTTIGTSTNILVVSIAAELGFIEFGIFDFVLPAVMVGSVGILYLWLIAPKLLPTRKMAMADESARIFTAQLFMAENNPHIGKSLAELVALTHGIMKVRRIRRTKEISIVPLPDARIQAGDRLLVSDVPDNLKAYEQDLSCLLYAGDHILDETHPLPLADQQLTEVAVYPGSALNRATLAHTRFHEQKDLNVVAIHRAGKAITAMPTGIQNMRLQIGDVLLVQGSAHAVSELKSQADLMVLDATRDLPRRRKAPMSLVIMCGVIALATTRVLPLSIVAALGVAAMLLCGCLNWKDVRDALSVQLVLMIVTTLALGQALLLTGGSDLLASQFLALMQGASQAWVLAGLIALMTVLTNIVSNNAAAVIGTPIAITVAQSLGAPPEAFVLGVLFGANLSYVTPMAYQTNLLVMNAIGYTFGDFVKVGLPLALLMWAGFSLALSILYGLI
jgi:di/tricarboxylate transporter